MLLASPFETGSVVGLSLSCINSLAKEYVGDIGGFQASLVRGKEVAPHQHIHTSQENGGKVMWLQSALEQAVAVGSR